MAVNSLVSQAAIVVALVAASLGAQAQTTIDLNADGNVETQSFAAGTYSVTFTDAMYSAYSLRYDYRNNLAQESYRTWSSLTDGGVTTLFGTQAEFGTKASALTAANALNFQFTTAGGPIAFRVYDTVYTDNRGGVSLSISAVPEPSTYSMMLAGLAAIGFVARRRRDA